MRALPRSAAALGTAHRPATTAATARWRSTARPRPASRTASLPAKPAGGSPAMSRAPRRARSARRPTRCGLPSPLSALLSPASTSCGSSPASSAAASSRAPTLTSSTRKCSSFVRSSAGCLRRLSKPVAQRESARRRPSHERPGYQPHIAGGDVFCHRVRPTMSPARLHVLIFCRQALAPAARVRALPPAARLAGRAGEHSPGAPARGAPRLRPHAAHRVPHGVARRVHLRDPGPPFLLDKRDGNLRS